MATPKAQQLWRQKNRERSLLIQTRSRAKREGIPFMLLLRDIRIPQTCPVLGIPLDGRTRNHLPSIDRFIPSLGYVPGNVCIISMKANGLKRNATAEELAKLAEYARLGEMIARSIHTPYVEAQK